MTVQDVDKEFYRRVLKDSRLTEIRSRIRHGTATFADTAEYNDRASTILGDVLSGQVPSTPEGERAKLCKYLLRHLYDGTNEMCAAVQLTLDKAQGLHLAPQKAPFPTERVQAIAGSLEDKTVPTETIQRRAGSAATVGRAFHDAYMHENAKFRTKAGIKCYLNREEASGCCKWCAEIAGRFVYGEHPRDIFRRHDNCSCTVTYENGRERQDVWSKRSWEAPAEGAGAAEPVTLTAEEAAAAQARHPLIRFTEGQAEKTQESVLTRETFSDIIDIILADHQRNPELERTIKQCITQAAPVFAEDLAKFFSRIPAEENRYIMAMHGNPQAAFIYGMQVTPKIVASIIKHRKDYHGEEVVFIACNTGNTDNISECFAQQLANELGNIVHAPTRFGAINSRGEYYSSDITGLKKDGEFIPFEPRRDEK